MVTELVGASDPRTDGRLHQRPQYHGRVQAAGKAMHDIRKYGRPSIYAKLRCRL